jgi:hypothetical protein
MRVMISRYNPERLRDIGAALRELWEFDPSEFPTEDEAAPVELTVSGVDNLTGGMTADDMAAKLAHAVTRAVAASRESKVSRGLMIPFLLKVAVQRCLAK